MLISKGIIAQLTTVRSVINHRAPSSYIHENPFQKLYISSTQLVINQVMVFVHCHLLCNLLVLFLSMCIIVNCDNPSPCGLKGHPNYSISTVKGYILTNYLSKY